MGKEILKSVLTGLCLAIALSLFGFLQSKWTMQDLAWILKPLLLPVLVGACGGLLYFIAVAIWDRRDTRRKEMRAKELERFRCLAGAVVSLRRQLNEFFLRSERFNRPIGDIQDEMARLTMWLEKLSITFPCPIKIAPIPWKSLSAEAKERICSEYSIWHQFLTELEVHVKTEDIEAARLVAPRIKRDAPLKEASGHENQP